MHSEPMDADARCLAEAVLEFLSRNSRTRPRTKREIAAEILLAGPRDVERAICAIRQRGEAGIISDGRGYWLGNLAEAESFVRRLRGRIAEQAKTAAGIEKWIETQKRALAVEPGGQKRLFSAEGVA